MRIALLGYGQVGGALAAAFLRAGHGVVLASNPGNPDGAEAARAQNDALSAAAVAPALDAAGAADLVVLAVPFGAVDGILAPLRSALAGRVLVDATNPVAPGLRHGLGSSGSGAEHVAALVPDTKVVKAFSVYGFENLGSPPGGPPGVRPAMPYAGDDPVAKGVVRDLLDGLGWDPIDVGGLTAALDLEHLTLLWIRMVRLGGLDPRFVWAALRAAEDA